MILKLQFDNKQEPPIGGCFQEVAALKKKTGHYQENEATNIVHITKILQLVEIMHLFQ